MMKTSLQSRRDFVKQAALVSLGFTSLARCATISMHAKPYTRQLPLTNDPGSYLDLPEGFSYRVISRSGKKMQDGFLVPGRPDGMGTFNGKDGKVIIVCNHENSPTPVENSPFGVQNELFSQIDDSMVYDAGQGKDPGLGGTTTMVYNEDTGEVEKQFLSLAGTYRNCAGGVTPWHSWLTCEEDVATIGGNIEKDHGFVFEVPASDQIRLAKPLPIKDMGRFNHEAVAVDPVSGIVYQTEDRPDGLIYRYIPDKKENLHEGGKLQVLAVKGKKSLDTRNWTKKTVHLHKPLEVEWLDIDEVLSPDDDLRYRGFESGAACFARGEGMWYGKNEIYFACTNGGPNKFGQVFRYKPSPAEGTGQENLNPGILELFAQSKDKAILNMCDNLTVAPWGDVILCEDNGELNYIRGINQQGELYNIACNRSSTSEFAGLVFSPSGKTLFVNIQENGETIAITGPWGNLA
ncbi:MAG: PhoX family protein [Cytophagales bacterium]|nr:PhoX family protein [Cytophagales bacterium]